MATLNIMLLAVSSIGLSWELCKIDFSFYWYTLKPSEIIRALTGEAFMGTL